MFFVVAGCPSRWRHCWPSASAVPAVVDAAAGDDDDRGEDQCQESDHGPISRRFVVIVRNGCLVGVAASLVVRHCQAGQLRYVAVSRLLGYKVQSQSPITDALLDLLFRLAQSLKVI